jgi:thioredoxin 2
MMAPAFAEACSKCVGRVVFAKFDTEADSEAAAAHRISSLPTIVLFKSGSELARQSGALNASQILRWVDAHIH